MALSAKPASLVIFRKRHLRGKKCLSWHGCLRVISKLPTCSISVDLCLVDCIVQMRNYIYSFSCRQIGKHNFSAKIDADKFTPLFFIQLLQRGPFGAPACQALVTRKSCQKVSDSDLYRRLLFSNCLLIPFWLPSNWQHNILYVRHAECQSSLHLCTCVRVAANGMTI